MTPHTHDADQDARLLSYWLDELDERETAEVEEHLFACDDCAARLRELLALRDAVRRALLNARFATTITPSFLQRLRDSGLNIREYPVAAGGSVTCTIAPQDDLVVSRLAAPLGGVRQVDLVFEQDDWQHRAAHVPFDAATNEVTVIPPVAMLRGLKQQTQRMRLVAVTNTAERVLGEYTFNHEPWR